MARHTKRPFIIGLVIGVVAVVAIGGMLSFVLAPLILKHHKSSPFEDWLGTNRVLAAIPKAYKTRTNPVPSNSQNMSEGNTVFLGNCAVCHGADGRGDSPIGQNLFPPAVALDSQRVKKMTDGEIYWIIENGLSFVGMPAFKTLLSEQQIWQSVLLIRGIQEGKSIQAAAPAQTGQEQGDKKPGAKVSAGKNLYTQKGCGACHGAQAEGGAGPALSGTQLSFAVLLMKVRSGGAVMPKYDSKTVSDAETRRIYEWLKNRP